MTPTATVPCADCGAPVDPRWLGRCREHEPSLHRCEECKAATAMSYRNIGGVKMRRCAGCAEAAERQAAADEACLSGKTKKRKAVKRAGEGALEIANPIYGEVVRSCLHQSAR